MDQSKLNDNYYMVLALIDALASQIASKANETEKSEEITWRQIETLVCIDQFSKYKNEYTDHVITDENSLPSINALADEMMTPRQNMQKLVHALEKKGYVLLKSDKTDKKKLLVKLTEKGHTSINNSYILESFSKNAFDGFTQEEIIALENSIRKISNNLCGMSDLSPISVLTCDGKKTITATRFQKCKISPRKKNRPLYQLYASKGALLQISGINRHIIGFYMSEDAIDREIFAINKAITRREKEYEVKYNCQVTFDASGLPIAVKEKDAAL